MLSKRHIKAPKTFDPGPGHPTEHLAYLSPAEMEMLRVMTDGTVSKGPKGLPSFVYSDSQSSAKSGPMGSGSFSVTPKAGSAAINSGSGSNSGGAKSSTSMAAATASKAASSSKASSAPKAPSAPSNAPRAPAASAAAAKANAAPKAPSAPVGGGSGLSRGPAASMAAAKASAPAMAAPAASAPSFSTARNSTLAQASGKAASDKAKTASALTAPNGSYYGPKGGLALNRDARLAAARSVGFSQPAVQRVPGDAAMLGRMMMAESKTIKNAAGLPRIDGLQGVADVVRNRMLSDQFPNTVPGVLGQRRQFSPMADGSFRRTPENATATRVAEAVLSGEQPPVVGNALNYANLHTVNTLPGYSSKATRQAFNSMQPTAVIADANRPVTMAHTFGTIGKNDVDFGGTPAYSPSAPVEGGFQTAAAVTSPKPSGPVPRPQARPWGAPPKPNPRPAVQGPPRPSVMTDPRVGLPVGAFPAAPRPPVPTARPPMQGPPRPSVVSDPRVGLPQGAFPAAAAPPVPTARPPVQGPPRPLSGDPRVNLPPGLFPARAQTTVPNDPRVGLPAGGFPAAPPPQSLVAGDPRVSMPPGSFPASRKDQARVPQEQGPVQQVDVRSPRVAAATYTAPYDVPAKGPNPFAKNASPGLPPGYAEKYGLGPKPAAPADQKPAEKGWIQAGFDAVNTGVQKAKETKQQVDQAVKDVEEKYGPITETKVQLAKMFLGISTGGKGKFRGGEGSGSASLNDPQVRAIVARVLASQEPVAPAPAPPVDYSYFTNVKTREQALRELLGEEWYA